MPFPNGLRALNHADFRLFFTAQQVAQIGTWMQTVAQSWLVLQLTDSPFRLGLIGTLQFAPILLFAIASGAGADCLPLRRLLVSTQLTLSCQALMLAALVASGRVQYWHVAVLAFVTGLANVLDQPARQSFVAEMVGKDDVGNAVALNSAAFNAARIVGPAVAGIVIARFGLVPAFLVNSVGFLVVIGALLRLRTGRSLRPEAAGTVLQQIAEGLRYARRTPEIVLSLGLLFVVSLCVFNFTVYVPLLARTVLGLGAEGFGFLMAALGMGAVAGALTAGSTRQQSRPALFATAALACSGLLGLSAARHFWAAVPVLFLTGFFGLVLVASCNTRLQMAAPDALRGRIMSLYTLVWGGVFPIGAFIVGTVSEHWGVARALLVNGAGGLAGVVLIFAWWRRR
jgi:predicted MFS family arabinose efflux permease